MEHHCASQCPLCKGVESTVIYSVENLPLFQNVVFDTEAEAVSAPVTNVSLAECHHCGFVWNKNYDESRMEFDKTYQNEQGLSNEFQKHLDDVLQLFVARNYQDKHIVEIACGKGTFLKKMESAGFSNIKGYDPAYEGDAENIVVDYFKKGSETNHADFIVLRQALDMIADPLGFLHIIGKANEYQGDIFIELTNFDWIKQKSAFWGINNEHCNYFSSDSITRMFDESEVRLLFGGQYLGLFAPLSKLREKAATGNVKKSQCDLNRKLEYYRELLNNSQKKTVIWGASSKGEIFANLLDKNRSKIEYLIDINPVKQGKFIGGTGHPIYPPPPHLNILVANGNYLDEVRTMASNEFVALQ